MILKKFSQFLKPQFSLILSSFLFLSLALNIFQFWQKENNDNGYRVVAVLDGDTILLEGETRVRLRTIDAPELTNCGGLEAKMQLEKLVSGKRVTLKEQIIDTWGRPLALVYTGDTLVNKEMLVSGWARYHNDANTQKEEMKAAYDEASSKNIGIFSTKCRQTENRENPKCNIKGNIDKSTNTKIYYVPGCAQYEYAIVEKDLGEQFFCSEKEAKAGGYVKSKNCSR